eukprot:m.37917 g.37917  ORF g.37917 m.37917 type:complete len:428 (-) comp10169_c0_seq1:1569-2852(-)
MSSSLWVLRLRCEGGKVEQLHEVDPKSTYNTFVKRVEEVVGVSSDKLHLLAGFPPKPMLQSTLDGSTTTLDSIPGMRNCTTIIVRGTVTPNSSSLSSTSTTTTATTTAIVKEVADKDTGENSGDMLEFMSTNLTKAVSGELSTSEANGIMGNLRKCVKDELLKVQQQRCAMNRQKAALAGEYEIGPVPGEYSLSGIMRNFRVTYSTFGKRTAEEDYRVISPIILKLMLRTIATHPDFKHNLQCFNMALLSPQVFWNLVRIYEDGNVEQSLQKLDPSIDWSFLNVRLRNRSEKALKATEMEDDLKQFDAECEQGLKMKKAEKRRMARQAKKKNSFICDNGMDNDSTTDILTKEPYSSTKANNETTTTSATCVSDQVTGNKQQSHVSNKGSQNITRGKQKQSSTSSSSSSSSSSRKRPKKGDKNTKQQM